MCHWGRLSYRARRESGVGQLGHHDDDEQRRRRPRPLDGLDGAVEQVEQVGAGPDDVEEQSRREAVGPTRTAPLCA